MKHAIPLFAFTFCLHLSLHAAVPLRWTVETSRATPATFEAYQGETIALEAALQSYGKPLEASGIAALYWQTNGMGSAYWETTAAVNSNRLSAVFTPEMDVGAKVYNCFIGVPGTIYHAAFQLRLRPSPGALPNVLPIPVPVIDFAKVRVLNPPWSGGGGGGAARPLPPYLHYIEMDDTYPEAAAEWYAQADYSGERASRPFSCSAVRSGNTLSRNYDWTFDFMPEFVVRCVATAPSPSCPAGRFASLAVCNVGTNLTEADVTSGKWSKWYKALPGHAVDGINENGVACEINVVGGAPAWDGGASPALHPLAAVRWVLDNATNALQAATYIASHIAFPQGWTQNFHYMVADETSTYIVEDGTAYPSGGTGVSPVSVLTNFRLYPTRDTTGEGQERYDALASGANITSQWWTLTYTSAGYRASDLPGITGEALTQLFNYWGNNPRESHRGERFGTMTWWQTVHTSVYDISNRTLRIAVQETDDWYVFQVPSSSAKTDAYTKAETDAKLAVKRDYNDLTCIVYTSVWETDVDIFPYVIKRGNPQYGSNPDKWYISSSDGTSQSIGVGDPDSTNLHWNAGQSIITSAVNAVLIRSVEMDELAPKSYVSGKADKVSGATEGNIAALTADGNLANSGRKVSDFLPSKGSFEISVGDSDADLFFRSVRIPSLSSELFYIGANRLMLGYRGFKASAHLVKSSFSDAIHYIGPGGNMVTPLTVDNEIAVKRDIFAAISATNETFAAEVLAVQVAGLSTNITEEVYIAATNACANLGIDPALIPQGGTLGTVGGLLLALAAAVALLRKKTKLLKSDGTAEDDFAADLLGKQVAKAAIAYSLKTGTDAMTDRAVKTYDGTSAQVDVTFPTNIPVGITDFEAWIKMGATVQTVTYPDDDYTIEWKDGKVPAPTDYKASATNVVHFTIVKESEMATPIVTAILAGFMAATPAA